MLTLTEAQRESLEIIRNTDGLSLPDLALLKWPKWTNTEGGPAGAAMSKIREIVRSLHKMDAITITGDIDSDVCSVFADQGEGYDDALYESVDSRRKVADFIMRWVLDVNGKFPNQLYQLLFRDMAMSIGPDALDTAVEVMAANDTQGRHRSLVGLIVKNARTRANLLANAGTPNNPLEGNGDVHKT